MYHFVQYLYYFIYLVTTLVVPCLDNIFMVLLISELAKIGVTKPIFLDSGSLGGGRGEVVRAWACFVIIV